MSDYKIEVLEPTMLEQVVALRQQLWGGSRVDNVAFLTWKYLANPYLTDPLIHVVRHQGSVVGMRAMFGTSWLVPGIDHPVILPCAADIGIAVEHRDKGLFTELNSAAEATLIDHGFRYVINMSATPANQITSIMTMGWRKVGVYEPLIRSTGPTNTAGRPESAGTARSPGALVQLSKRSKWLRNVARQTKRVRQNTFGKNPFAELDKHLRDAGGDSLVEITTEPRPEKMAELAARFDDRERIHHLRDETYFAWRYSTPLAMYRLHPGPLHRRFLFWGAGNAEGFAVFQGDPGATRVNLVDWSGDEATFAKLLNTAIARAR